MLTLFALRHASTRWNVRGLMQGRRDIALSPAGRAEAASWRLPVEPPLTWVSSPLSRAVQTARIMSGHAPRIESALIEMHWGEWEGFTLDELHARDAGEFERNEALGLDFRPPGGESPREVCDRLQLWLGSLQGAAGAWAVVTHNGVLRAMLALATGWDMTCKPPVKLKSGAAHRFGVRAGGALELQAPNVPLAASRARQCA